MDDELEQQDAPEQPKPQEETFGQLAPLEEPDIYKMARQMFEPPKAEEAAPSEMPEPSLFQRKFQQSLDYFAKDPGKHFGRLSGDYISERIPGINIGHAIEEYGDLWSIAKKLEKDPDKVEDAEIHAMARFIAKMQHGSQKTGWEQGVDLATHLPGLMAEWMATGGSATAARSGVAKWVATKLPSLLGEGLTKAAARATPEILAAGAARTALMPSTGVHMAQRLVETTPEGLPKAAEPLEAIGKGAAQSLIQNTIFEASGAFHPDKAASFLKAWMTGSAKAVGAGEAVKDALYVAALSPEGSPAREAAWELATTRHLDFEKLKKIAPEVAVFGTLEGFMHGVPRVKAWARDRKAKGLSLESEAALADLQKLIQEEVAMREKPGLREEQGMTPEGKADLDAFAERISAKPEQPGEPQGPPRPPQAPEDAPGALQYLPPDFQQRVATRQRFGIKDRAVAEAEVRAEIERERWTQEAKQRLLEPDRPEAEQRPFKGDELAAEIQRELEAERQPQTDALSEFGRRLEGIGQKPPVEPQLEPGAIRGQTPEGVTREQEAIQRLRQGEQQGGIPGLERRTDSARRKRLAEMSPEEMRHELTVSRLEGESEVVELPIPNARAFHEAEAGGKAKVVAFSDSDGLKALNDTFKMYDAGNAMLKAKAEVLKEAGLEAYHQKGDEFIYRGKDAADLASRLEKARELMEEREFSFIDKEGKRRTFKGASFSFGLGENLAKAHDTMMAQKGERKAKGETGERGQLGRILEVASSEGGPDRGRTVGKDKGSLGGEKEAGQAASVSPEAVLKARIKDAKAGEASARKAALEDGASEAQLDKMKDELPGVPVEEWIDHARKNSLKKSVADYGKAIILHEKLVTQAEGDAVPDLADLPQPAPTGKGGHIKGEAAEARAKSLEDALRQRQEELASKASSAFTPENIMGATAKPTKFKRPEMDNSTALEYWKDFHKYAVDQKAELEGSPERIKTIKEDWENEKRLRVGNKKSIIDFAKGRIDAYTSNLGGNDPKKRFQRMKETPREFANEALKNDIDPDRVEERVASIKADESAMNDERQALYLKAWRLLRDKGNESIEINKTEDGQGKGRLEKLDEVAEQLNMSEDAVIDLLKEGKSKRPEREIYDQALNQLLAEAAPIREKIEASRKKAMKAKKKADEGPVEDERTYQPENKPASKEAQDAALREDVEQYLKDKNFDFLDYLPEADRAKQEAKVLAELKARPAETEAVMDEQGNLRVGGQVLFSKGGHEPVTSAETPAQKAHKRGIPVGPAVVIKTIDALLGGGVIKDPNVPRRFAGEEAKGMAMPDKNLAAIDKANVLDADLHLHERIHLRAKEFAMREALAKLPSDQFGKVAKGFQEFYDAKEVGKPVTATQMEEGFANWGVRRVRGELTSLTENQKAAAAFAESFVKDKPLGKALDHLGPLFERMIAADPIQWAQNQARRKGDLPGPMLTKADSLKGFLGKVNNWWKDFITNKYDVFRRSGMEKTHDYWRSSEYEASRLEKIFADEGIQGVNKDGRMERFGVNDAKMYEGIKLEELREGPTGGASKFGSYMLTRHIVDEFARGREPRPAASRAQWEAAWAEFKKDADFSQRAEAAAKRMTNNFNATLRARESMGIDKPGTADTFIASHPTYVPLLGIVEGSPFKKGTFERKGHAELLMDPVKAWELRKKTTAQIMADHLRKLSVAEDLALSDKGLALEVEAPIEVGRDIVNRLDKLDLSKQELAEIKAALGDKDAKIFMAPKWSDDPHANVVSLPDGKGGRRHFRIFDRTLYDVITGQLGDNNVAVMAARFIGQMPGMRQAKEVVRFGATGANMAFQFSNALLRDPFTFLANTKNMANFFQLLPSAMKAAKYEFDVLAGKAEKDPLMSLYMREGGRYQKMFDFEESSHGPIKGTIRSGWDIFHKVFNVAGSPELGPRFTEAMESYKRDGWTREKIIDAYAKADKVAEKTGKWVDPIAYEVHNRARLAGSEVTVNFPMVGELTQAINTSAVFFGPSVAGIGKAIRNVKENPKGAATALGLYLSLRLMHYAMFKDEEWYKELNAFDKFSNFIFPINGKLWRIPGPRELDRAAGAIMMNGLEHARTGGRPDNIGMLKEMRDAVTPSSPVPVPAKIAWDLQGNEKWSGAPIVPKRDEKLSGMEKAKQYQIPYAVEQATGGRAVLDLKKPLGLDIVKEAHANRSTRELKQRVEELEAEKLKVTRKAGKFAQEAELRRLKSVQTRINSMFKNWESLPEEKQAEIRKMQLKLAQQALGAK